MSSGDRGGRGRSFSSRPVGTRTVSGRLFCLGRRFSALSLHRTIDLLLLDATDLAGIQALLPVGRLREPLAAAARASAILFTRVESDAQMTQIWQSLTQACGPLPDPMTIVSRPRDVSASQRVNVDPQWVSRDIKAIVFSGIGNARSFHESVIWTRYDGVGYVRDEGSRAV